jgi:hypothetical protein
MLNTTRASRAHRLVAILVSCSLGLLASATSVAQTPDGVVPITSEPDHKIRFDNGRVRIYEVVLPKGKATLMHEHRADSFTVFFRTAEVTNEPHGGGKPVMFNRTPGFVSFTSTAKGPYSHRVIASGETTFHVIAMELLSPAPAGSATTSQRLGSAFKLALENPRGRAYRVTLAPGESTETFTRPAGSALFAISAGRISETVDGKSARLWDFDPAHFRWFENSEKVSMKNESSTPIELVEIEVF